MVDTDKATTTGVDIASTSSPAGRITVTPGRCPTCGGTVPIVAASCGAASAAWPNSGGPHLGCPLCHAGMDAVETFGNGTEQAGLCTACHGSWRQVYGSQADADATAAARAALLSLWKEPDSSTE